MHESGGKPGTVAVRWGEVTLHLDTDPRMRPWAEVEASELLLARHAIIAAANATWLVTDWRELWYIAARHGCRTNPTMSP